MSSTYSSHASYSYAYENGKVTEHGHKMIDNNGQKRYYLLQGDGYQEVDADTYRHYKPIAKTVHDHMETVKSLNDYHSMAFPSFFSNNNLIAENRELRQQIRDLRKQIEYYRD